MKPELELVRCERLQQIADELRREQMPSWYGYHLLSYGWNAQDDLGEGMRHTKSFVA